MIEHFVLGDKIGVGSHSTVYHAVHEITQLNFAIKVLPKITENGKENKEHFDLECALLKKLQHKHVAKLYRTIEDEDNFYFIMEEYTGGNLSNFVKSHAPVTETFIKEMFSQLLTVIEYFHSVSYQNPCISPEHILLDSSGNIKVSGFGHTQLDNLLFVSPEYFKYHCLTQESDVWALGVLLYYVLTGEYPFVGENPEKIMVKVLFTVPQIPETIPPLIISLLTSMLTKEIDERSTIQQLKTNPFFANLFDDKLLILQRDSQKKSEIPNPQKNSVKKIIKRRDSDRNVRTRTHICNRKMRASSMITLMNSEPSYLFE